MFMNLRLIVSRVLLFAAFVFFASPSQAQYRNRGTYYEQRATLFDALPTSDDDIIFLGNSITDGCEWSELFGDSRLKNRGISGDVCDGVLDRLTTITRGQPAKVFLMIGINDVNHGLAPDTIAMKVQQIVARIKAESPRTMVYVQSVLPTNDCYGMFNGHTSRWQMVAEINALLMKVAEVETVSYIDLYSLFATEEGKMNPDYSNDGLHLTGKGYLVWRDAVKAYL